MNIPEPVLAYMRERRQIVRRIIARIEDGSFETGEYCNRQKVNTTAESLATAKRELAELDELLADFP